jgi:hypothetical protein
MSKALEKFREKIVEEFNSQFPADTVVYDSDGDPEQDSLGRDIRINSNWILDSEYMCFVYEGTASQRIKQYIGERIYRAFL